MSAKAESGEYKKIEVKFEELVSFNILVAVDHNKEKYINKEKILCPINRD